MIGLLVWLAVAVGLAYEITTHGMWRDGLAACAVLALILWVLGGASFFAATRRTLPKRKDTERVP